MPAEGVPGAIAQLAERWFCIPEVRGSTPLGSTEKTADQTWWTGILPRVPACVPGALDRIRIGRSRAARLRGGQRCGRGSASPPTSPFRVSRSTAMTPAYPPPTAITPVLSAMAGSPLAGVRNGRDRVDGVAQQAGGETAVHRGQRSPDRCRAGAVVLHHRRQRQGLRGGPDHEVAPHRRGG